MIGHTLQYLRDPFGFAFGMHARHGPIFRSRVFFERGIAVASLDFAELFFTDREELFSSRQGWWNVLGAFFPGGLMLRDFGEHRLHRRIMQAAFKADALRGYMGIVEPIMARAMRELESKPELKAYPFIKQLLLDTAAAVFVGAELGAESTALNRDFARVMHAAGAAVRKPIPGTPYWRGLRARRRLEAWFSTLLETRDETGRRDMLSLLKQAETEDGERFSPDEIVQHILFLLMAAHDTTTSGLTCLLMLLATHPEQQERAREEALAAPEAPGFDELNRFPLLFDCFREALRLYPPVRAIPRRTTRACEVEGHAIPANTPMWVNTEVNHRDPSVWERPDAFEPDRFAPPREEHKRHKFAWIPFGAGPHTCLGLQFSRLEVTSFMVPLLRRFRVSVKNGWLPRMQYMPFVKPRDDLPLRLERL